MRNQRANIYTNTKSGKVNLHRVINRIIHIVLTHYDCAPPSASGGIYAAGIFFYVPVFSAIVFFFFLHTYSCVNVDSRQSHAMRHTHIVIDFLFLLLQIFDVTIRMCLRQSSSSRRRIGADRKSYFLCYKRLNAEQMGKCQRQPHTKGEHACPRQPFGG